VYLFVNFFLETFIIIMKCSNSTLLLLVNPHIYRIKIMAPLIPIISIMMMLPHCQLCSTHNTAVRINNCLKRTSAIKVANIKITNNFCYEWKPTTKSTLFTVGKDGTCKSMKNALYVQWCGKRHLSDVK